jgi:DNA polymerase-3 subunit delta'
MNTRNLVQSPVMSAYGENWGLIGHEWAVDLLARRLAAGRVGHAYLFTGMSGVGKSTLATRLAQAINCTGDTPPCGACRACTLTESGAHPDVSFVEGDKGAIKIEAIRDLQNFLSLQPFEARSRIGIILRGQELTAQAADALLKTLEEPAPGARLLLTASMVDSLAATIASRCQVIHLRGVPAAQIEAALRERTDCSPSEAALLAGLAGGRPGWALGAAQNPDVLAWRAEVLDQLLAALYANRSARFQCAEGLARGDDLPELLAVWQSWWRDVVLLAEGSPVGPLNADRLDDLTRIAAAVAPADGLQALRTVRETLRQIDTTNVNKRLALDVMLLDLPYLS